ncbi:MAG: nicotinate-nucleotide--dimethylbenzimidazole phosphoribosyltransferase [Pseudomonadota bacterium]
MQLEEIILKIEPIDNTLVEQAARHTGDLCMPPRALGRLHEIAERLCGITRSLTPSVQRKAFVVMAGDHGVVKRGVSAFPQEVTGQMIENFIRGGAGINVLARQLSAEIVVVDMGVKTELPSHLERENRFIQRRIASGTDDFTTGPAMTIDQARQAVLTGFEIATSIFQQGVELLGTGDMGIGNTTPSSAIGAVITKKTVDIMTGRGTGISDESLQKKCELIKQGISFNRPDPEDGLDVLAKVGGFEIGGIAGLVLAGAYHQKPVVIDGLISTAGALIAHRLCPLSSQYAFAGHCSVEPGHRHMLDHLGLDPIINLELRLGEGTGAALAMHIIEAACRVFNEVSTFSSAGVSTAM